jgi:hypothetical protein
MKILILLTLTVFGLTGLVLAGEGGDGPVALEAGVPAPDFNLPGSDGRNHTLAEHRGERAVVIAWFPKAFTGG